MLGSISVNLWSQEVVHFFLLSLYLTFLVQHMSPTHFSVQLWHFRCNICLLPTLTLQCYLAILMQHRSLSHPLFSATLTFSLQHMSPPTLTLQCYLAISMQHRSPPHSHFSVHFGHFVATYVLPLDSEFLGLGWPSAGRESNFSGLKTSSQCILESKF